MIRLKQKGLYRLRETSEKTTILNLDKKKFALLNDAIVYIPTSSFKKGKDGLLSSGAYRLYVVKNESALRDACYLELFTNEGKCKSFLLPAGLPTGRTKTRGIEPTAEMVTKTIH